MISPGAPKNTRCPVAEEIWRGGSAPLASASHTPFISPPTSRTQKQLFSFLGGGGGDVARRFSATRVCQPHTLHFSSHLRYEDDLLAIVGDGEMGQHQTGQD